MSRFGGHVRGVRTKSTATDPVSEADLAAEAAIRRVLGERRPADAILGEEGGATGDGELRWVIDPLDGTVNFLFGIPQFSVSVACRTATGMVVGVVLDPVREETFAASRSGPPTLNGETIAGSARDDLATALVSTGFAYDAAVRAKQAVVMGRVLPRVRDIRRAGVGRARPRLARLRALRRLLRARRQPLGLRRGRAHRRPRRPGRARAGRRRRRAGRPGGGSPGAHGRVAGPDPRRRPALDLAPPRRWWNGRHDGLKIHCP